MSVENDGEHSSDSVDLIPGKRAGGNAGSGKSSGDESGRKAERRPLWKRLLKPVLAIALLLIVVKSVPRHDRMIWTRGEDTAHVAGRLVGDWRVDETRFTCTPAALVDAGLPVDVLTTLEQLTQPIELSREPGATHAWAAGGAVDWRPGLTTIFRDIEPGGLLIALLALFGGMVVSGTRWWRMLHIAGCATSWLNAVRLTILGYFFNLIVPAGMTGGDVVKALIVVRENPDRKADAVISIVADRLLGLIALVLLAALVILGGGERFAQLRLAVTLALCASALGVFLVLSPAPRRFMPIAALLQRMPQQARLRKLDQSLRAYARHPVEIGFGLVLSFGNHLLTMLAVFTIGRAFGDQLTFGEVIAVVAVANTISALPLAPGGWGVGEAAFGTLYALLGAPATLGIAISLTYRTLYTSLGLIGGALLFMFGGDLMRKDLERSRMAAQAVEPGDESKSDA